MQEHVKQIAFRGIGAAERIVRGAGTWRVSLDPAKLRLIRNFVVPAFEPFLGAIIHETPLLEALRVAMPDAQIVVAAAPLGAQVLEHNPMVSRLEVVPNPTREFRAGVASLRKIVGSFRGEPWCALFTVWNPRSRLAMAMMLSGSGVRAGYCVAPELLHLPLEYDQSQSQIANNLRLPALVSHKTPELLEPRVYFGPDDLEQALALLSVPENLSHSPVAVFVTQTNPGQSKKWRIERFIEAAQWLVRAHGCRIVLVGSSAEAGAVGELRDRIGANCQSLAGQTTIPALAAVLALADVALTLDTGIMHVARAVALPACIIAPAWSPIHEWLPLQNPRYLILKNLDLPTMPAGYIIDEVSVDEVRGALSNLLQKYPPSTAARESRIERSMTRGDIRRTESLV